jgi:cold shock CspA family protein
MGNFRRGGRNNNRNSVSNLPLEEGIICSLRESFGFIHCAERPCEIFFHYSEVANCHPDDLQIDTEVQFRVGTSKNDPQKLAAFEVITLPPNTVVWETEEEPDKIIQGLVEKMIRNSNFDSRRSGRASNNPSDNLGTIRVQVEGEEKSSSGPLIRFRNEDYHPPENIKRGLDKLHRGDLVQFRILTDRRTKQKYARFIELLKSEKERSREERERRLMETAVEEDGKVVSLMKDYGFIRSTKRKGHVFFHYSYLTIPESDDEFELKEGQELKFLVVTETDEKCSARQLECIPKGSVVFHHDVACGIHGLVEVCPRPPIGSGEKYGTIRLVDPITYGDESIKNVLLSFSDSPGGSRSNKHNVGNNTGLWIENGDTLLFDVVKEVADGSFRAVPTRHTLGKGGIVEVPSEKGGSPLVRFVAASLVHRAEGVVQTVKKSSGFGFIQFSESSCDVHFKTFNIFPEDLQSDLRKQLGYDGKPIQLQSGASAQFDICYNSHGNDRSKRGRGNDRESVTGHRILLLPPEAVFMDKPVKEQVKGVIKSVEIRNIYSGLLDLEEELELMSLEERHPLVAQMIHTFVEESTKPNGRSQLVFRDMLSIKEDDVVVEMVKLIAGDKLRCTHIPFAGNELHPGRLCIRCVEDDDEKQEEEDNGIPKPWKKKNRNKPSYQGIHFDNASFSQEFKEDVSPGVGDVVICDIVQSRRTERFVVQNMRIIEKNESNESIGHVGSGTPGVGIVKEVIPKRNFGFIWVLDETVTKREVLFFNLSADKNNKRSSFRKGDEVKFDIVTECNGKRVATNVETLAKGTIPSKATKNACQGFVLMEPSNTSLSDAHSLRKTLSHMSIGGEKSGGRWDDRADDSKVKGNDSHKQGCILLVEDKTGMFKKHGRRKIKVASNEGTSGTPKEDDALESVDTFDSYDDTQSADSIDESGNKAKSGEEEEQGIDDAAPFKFIHLPYKNGAIAIHGSGSSSSMDGSTNPRRGDLVSFVGAKGDKTLRDVRIVTRQAATFVQGHLENIKSNGSSGQNLGKAKFVAATKDQEEYEIDLCELVSCDVAALKEQQMVEAILHEGKLYGLCRTVDLYLESKLGTGKKKERPKLNLSVKKTRGGTIMAQSMMAKGPDGTSGFDQGWTTRSSLYAAEPEEQPSS